MHVKLLRNNPCGGISNKKEWFIERSHGMICNIGCDAIFIDGNNLCKIRQRISERTHLDMIADGTCCAIIDIENQWGSEIGN